MSHSCSLHIGINRTQHVVSTSSTMGVLRFCHSDAWTMADIARAHGYQSVTVLLDTEATFDRVVEEVLRAANSVRDGGTFLWTFSGHGTIAPSLEIDEEGKFDEGWVLADGILLDNCIHSLLAKFDSSAVIDLVSDCCHSGDMALFRNEYAEDFNRDIMAFAPDDLPREKQLNATALMKATGGTVNHIRTCPVERITKNDIKAAVISIGACHENEIAADGAFTPILKEQLSAAHESLAPDIIGYNDLIARVTHHLRGSQNPKLKTLGRLDEALLQRSPFSIVSPSFR